MSMLKSPIDGDNDMPTLEADEKDDNAGGVESESDEDAENENESENDSKEEDSDSDADIKKPIQTGVDEAIDKIKNKTFKFGSSEDRKRFFGAYGEWIKQKTEDDRTTILHLLLSSREISPKTLEHPVKYIVRKYPKLLLEYDREKKTPLYLATESSKMAKIVDIMIDSCKYYELALSAKCREKRENCLHLAMRSKHIPAETKLMMIRMAPNDAISAEDYRGYTPLHYAVEYKRCTEEQFEVIKALIAKDDSAFTNETKAPESRSVFQYHAHTRAIFDEPRTSSSTKTSTSLRSKPKATTKKDEDPKEQPQKEEKQLDPKAAEKAIREKREAELERKKKEMSSTTGARHTQGRAKEETELKAKEPPGGLRQPTFGHGAGLKDAADPRHRDPRQADSLDLPMVGIGRKPTVSFEETAKEEKRSRKTEKEIAKVDREALDKWADLIKMELKLHCMRTRTPDQTARFLYGRNKEGKQICFEYFGAPETIKSITFQASFDHVKFDEVLQYVAFPRLEVLPRPPLSKDFPSERLGNGRTDMLFFFDWLRSKSVKRILRVIVEDSDRPSHSDEVIEKALAGFQVECLDWQKVDLDPETICNVSSNLREVTLHWSGNNAVLRGWSEPQGLRMLKDLERVHLHIHRDLETVDRSSLYYEKFCARLNEGIELVEAAPAPGAAPTLDTAPKLTIQVPNGDDAASELGKDEVPAQQPKPKPRKEIKVTPHNNDHNERTLLAASPSAVKTESKAEATSHRWLDTTDQFADMIQNVWATILRKNRGSPLASPVVVALIDDGVDMYHQSLQGKICDGQSFDFGNREEGRVKPYWVSEKGHGTIMANMICRVCPMAKVIAIRLETQSSGKNTNIVVKSAAAAIDAAVEKGAQIISMSWTVTPPTDPAEKDCFDEAMRNAVKKNVLMFCSSSDGGHYSDVDYPTASSRENVFRIGASQDDGLPYSWAGPVDKLDYIFPGVEVVQRNPLGVPGIDSWKPETGSSIATALAAGLAALIIYCVKIGALYTQMNPGAKATGVSSSDVEMIKWHKNMKEAFDGIGASRETQHKFIEVWKLFEGPAMELKRSDHDTRMETVANLARNLVPFKGGRS